MKDLAVLFFVGGLITWVAFVAACVAHALYYYKASQHIPPSRLGRRWTPPTGPPPARPQPGPVNQWDR